MNGFGKNIDSEKEYNLACCEYSKNPFTPKGKMSRLYYFIYILLMGLIVQIISVCSENVNSNFDFLFFLSFLAIIIFYLFIVKKRILDITNNNKKSWIFASIFIGVGIVLEVISEYLVYILLPFGIYILCKGAYKNKCANFESCMSADKNCDENT